MTPCFSMCKWWISVLYPSWVSPGKFYIKHRFMCVSQQGWCTCPTANFHWLTVGKCPNFWLTSLTLHGRFKPNSIWGIMQKLNENLLVWSWLPNQDGHRGRYFVFLLKKKISRLMIKISWIFAAAFNIPPDLNFSKIIYVNS